MAWCWEIYGWRDVFVSGFYLVSNTTISKMTGIFWDANRRALVELGTTGVREMVAETLLSALNDSQITAGI